MLFRLFDGFKPFPIDYIDKKYKNTFGILFDDVLAGFYVVLSLILFMIENILFLMKKLNKKVLLLLKKKKLKLSIVESCTGGLLSTAITSVNGSSKDIYNGIGNLFKQSKKRISKKYAK